MNTHKLSLASIEGKLSRKAMKDIFAGVLDSAGGRCIRCTTKGGLSSCYYTKQSGPDLCKRVYPDASGTYEEVADCKGCIMN